MPAAVLDADPLPFAALMGLGFLVGALGHLYGSRVTIAIGILLVMAATVLLPLGSYLSGR
jgi:uncharacterized protein (DUF697 family)